MATNIPFTRGRDVKVKFYQDDLPILMDAKNFDIEENATEANDGVCGEDRDRLDKVTNYYSGSFDIYQTDQHIMQSIMDAQAQDDAAGIPLTQLLSVRFNNRDGTRTTYLLKECKFGPFKDNAGGRGDNVMLNVKIRGRYWDKAVSS